MKRAVPVSQKAIASIAPPGDHCEGCFEFSHATHDGRRYQVYHICNPLSTGVISRTSCKVNDLAVNRPVARGAC
jgi:hypothetical protein